jgi:hypothetical protein
MPKRNTKDEGFFPIQVKTFWFKNKIYYVVLCQIFEGHLQGAQSDFVHNVFFKVM